MKNVRRLFALSAGLVVLSAGAASASCYGTGYSRYCDGIGGSNATYSPRGNSGSTTYYNGSGSVTRQQTYTTTPNYGGGYTRQQTTTYYGR